NAAVTIVEYTDYQCPFCNRHAQETMPQLIENMVDTGRVYYVIKDFPLDQLHPEARAAALAARCAGEQEAYLEMHDAIFASQANWSGQGDAGATAYFSDLAADLDLDTAVYDDCVTSSNHPDNVQANLEEGSVLGVTGTPAFFINGYLVSGAQPYDVFEYVIELGENDGIANAIEAQARQAYQAYLEQQNQPPPQPPTPAGPVDIPTDEAHSIGDPDAPVTLIEYTDYQCPFCGRHFQQTFPLIQEQYIDTGQVRYVFKDFPLTRIHPQAVAAANAARCAGEQGAYLEFHNKLFDNQDAWNNGQAETIFIGYAAELGLDKVAFGQCVQENRYEEAIIADLNEGIDVGVSGTPAFFINGRFLSGAQPFEAFVSYIEAELGQ
ncbi:MAG TPA: thioredoxin, partial [Anaerolineae bacterium]|nr:thioredoxin [Anaerolineae bacterium]